MASANLATLATPVFTPAAKGSLFPYLPLWGNTDRTQPVAPMLVKELERRCAELEDAGQRLVWTPMQNLDASVEVKICPKSDQVTLCGWPILSLSVVLPHTPRACVALMQDLKAQSSRSMNRRVVEMTELQRVCTDGESVSPVLAAALSRPSSSKGLDIDWCEDYMTIAYVYTQVESFAPDMKLPPMDTIDLVAVRPVSDDKPHNWRIQAMSAYFDTKPGVSGVLRLEHYATMTSLDPISVQVKQPDGSTKTEMHTRLETRSCLRGDYTFPPNFENIFTFMRIKEECAHIEAMMVELKRRSEELGQRKQHA